MRDRDYAARLTAARERRAGGDPRDATRPRQAVRTETPGLGTEIGRRAQYRTAEVTR